MLKHGLLIVMAVGCGLLGGCASIVNGVSQSISVTTPPVQGASCALSNTKGTWYISNTPGSVVVHRSYSVLNVHCQKPGYHEANSVVSSNPKAMAAGNVVFGGIVGLGVDTVDGAAFNYPTNIIIPMQKK
jgi:hypothetical protein